MKKEELESLLNIMTSTGSDYSDIFYEEKYEKTIKLLDSKIDDIIIEKIKGIGLRVCDGHNTFYSATNNLDYKNLEFIAKNLNSNIKKECAVDTIKLNDLIDKNNKELKKDLNEIDKKEYLLNIDKIARDYDSKISQVRAQFFEGEQNVLIATSEGRFVHDKRLLKRLIIVVYASDEAKIVQSVFSAGSSFDYAFLDDIDIKKVVIDLAQKSLCKLTAQYAPRGRMPVIISNDSGVLIHEACGHALEATSVADNSSILGNSLGKKVASDIVTIIDDGTILNFWGSSDYDDEGEITKKNILIENGILKSFLVDKKNSNRMNHKVTGSGRRESYHLSPTSRMNNTYLDKGDSKITDMIKSIDYGLYASKIGGGEVNVVTGDFNFGVDEAYVIRDGKICEMVIGASLIGNIKEVLHNIEMISDDLNCACGLCGSESGWVPVTDGQPTIKLSSILVGGKQ